MCPPAPVPPLADISLYWSDEELFTSLDKIIRGSPVPDNVIPDVNPYQIQPSVLPDGVWYLISSEEKKDAEHGFWKAKGEATDIFTNSTITGWRTTLEFYEGQVPNGRRTDWVMQEYGITQKGPGDNSKPKVINAINYPLCLFLTLLLFPSLVRPASQLLVWLDNMQDSRSLCRVFLSDKQSTANEMPQKDGDRDVASQNHISSSLSVVPNPGSTSGQGSTSEFQANNRDDATGLLVVADRLEDPPRESLADLDYILRGDYMELDDLLVDPESPSSSSDNTSCLSLTSEECFDALALLKDLERGKDTSFKYTASAPAKPREVVMHPPTLGSLNNESESKLSPEETRKSDNVQLGSAIEGERMPKRLLEHISISQQANQGASNSEKKAHVGGMKKLKKYLCFM
ncbi:hypothetical protein LguiB_020058 [Lonicera macranthoides]